jgi:hypothetical protein
MNTPLTLRGFSIAKGGKWKTRRFHGRRSVTPMRHKSKKPSKTRCISKVERTDFHGIPIRKHTSASQSDERDTQNKDEHCEDQERKGNKDCDDEGKRKDAEVHEEVEPLGNSEYSEQPVHPGSIQELRELPASVEVTDETGPEEEEPPF